MATQPQILANQQNAQKSTGPRTPEGKARSSHNATRHGLTSKELVVFPEERSEFETLRADLLHDIQPLGAVQMLTFNMLLHAAWNIQRYRRIEAEVFLNCDGDPLDNPELDARMDRLARYAARAERAYYKALAKIRELQTNTLCTHAAMPAADKQSLTYLGDIRPALKQTQIRAETAVAQRIAQIETETRQLLAQSRSKFMGENCIVK